ncbi:MAG: electron transfer flavoprotein subunit alpha/FixB family protein [Acidimicrobiia bacterium]
MRVLVLIEHDRGELDELSLEAVAMARQAWGEDAAVHAALLGEKAHGLAPLLADHGVAAAHLVHHELLTDFGPDAWAACLAQLIDHLEPDAVLATGTEKGNEVMAHLGARLDLPMVANAVEIDSEACELTRVRWGGSLLERVRLTARIALVTVSPHAFEPDPIAAATRGHTEDFRVELTPDLTETMIKSRTAPVEGATLATAPVVVSGGRGTGSVEGFAQLEELAGLLGGVVGCSRVVTNNGWRPHKDQVGQTGTVIAPDLYVACGISGAIQHWVGMMASKTVLAINHDPDAPMVTKADYAVVADLHEVVPAVIQEIRRRRAAG